MIRVNDKYCAFLDILGFKDLFIDPLRQTRQATKVQIVTEYKKIMDSIWGNLWAHAKIARFSGMKTSMKWMAVSDSIIISGKDIHWLMLCCAEVQRQLLHHYLLVRGGIGYGAHWEHWDSRKCYILSTAYVDAYKLESEHKCNIKSGLKGWPRIVLHQNVWEKVSQQDVFDRNVNPPLPWVIQCEDDKIMVNPFIGEIDPLGIEPELGDTCEKLFTGEKYSFGQSQQEKWRWFAAAYAFIGSKYGAKGAESEIACKYKDWGIQPLAYNFRLPT